MDAKRDWPDYFYYAAPLWLALETFFWPGFRAGTLTGGGFWGNAAFYGAEWGLGAALFFRLPWAGPAALAENVLLLVFYFRWVLFTPLDVAANIEDASAQAAAAGYAAALPGVLWSCVQVMFRIKSMTARRPG